MAVFAELPVMYDVDDNGNKFYYSKKSPLTIIKNEKFKNVHLS